MTDLCEMATVVRSVSIGRPLMIILHVGEDMNPTQEDLDAFRDKVRSGFVGTYFEPCKILILPFGITMEIVDEKSDDSSGPITEEWLLSVVPVVVEQSPKKRLMVGI